MTTTNNKFPGLNFKAPVSIDDFKALTDENYIQVVNRMQAVFGKYLEDGGNYGIMATTDPVDTIANAVPTQYFQVDWKLPQDLTTNNKGVVFVNIGNAITSQGNLISTTETVELNLLNGVTATQGNTNFVIFAEYALEDDIRYSTSTLYGYSGAKRIKTINPIQFATWTDWTNTSIYTQARIDNILPLAYITFVYTDVGYTTGTPAYIFKEIDHTANTISNMRPWFSPIDIRHRNEVGTGSVNTPHSIGLSDLSEGLNTLYSQLLPLENMVYAKAIDIINCPGTLCYEDISANSVLTDTSGEITGVIGALYIELTKFPHKILGAVGPIIDTLSDDDNDDVAVLHLPGTNIIILGEGEEWVIVPVRIWYTSVMGGSPTVDSAKNGGTTLTVNALRDYEIMIAEGKGITAVNTNTYDFSSHVLFPQKFKMYYDKEGELIISPQSIVCNTKLTDVSTTLQTNSNELYTPCRLKIGLYTNQDPLYFEITLNGKDQDGTLVSEIIKAEYVSAGTSNTFRPTGSGGTWSPIPSTGTPPAWPVSEIDSPVYTHVSATSLEYTTNDVYNYRVSGTTNYGNFVKTATVFSELTSWQITSGSAGVTGTYIEITAAFNPQESPLIRNLLYCSDILWNGQAIVGLYDRRKIGDSLGTTPHGDGVLSSAMGLNLQHTSTDQNVTLLFDSLNDPYYLDYNKSNINVGYIGNTIPNNYSYPENIYTSRAIPLDYAITSGTSFDTARLVIYTNEVQSFRQYNSASSNNPAILWRHASDVAPLDWSSWVAASPITNAGYINRRTFNLTDMIFTPPSGTKVIKYQIKIFGDFVGYSLHAQKNI